MSDHDEAKEAALRWVSTLFPNDSRSQVEERLQAMVDKVTKRKFSVPVVFTVSGWIEIHAGSLEKAREKAKQINERGVNFFDIKDSSTYSECMVDEIEELG